MPNHLQLLNFCSKKKVKFKTNFTFFLEHLKGYSRKSGFEASRGVVEILPTNVTHYTKKTISFFL